MKPLAGMQNLVVGMRAQLCDAHLREVLVPADPVGPLRVDAERHLREAHPLDGLRQAWITRCQQPHRGVKRHGVRRHEVLVSTTVRAWTSAPTATTAPELWLNAGVPVPEVAKQAGHSVDILLRVYAKCMDGQQEQINDPLDT